MTAETAETPVRFLSPDEMYRYFQGFVTGAGLTLEGDENADELVEAMSYLAATRARR